MSTLEHEGAKATKNAKREEHEAADALTGRSGERRAAPEKGPSVEAALPWTEGQWHGIRQLRCALCPFDTLEGDEAMIEHIEARHAPEPPPEPPAPLVQAYDVWGKPTRGGDG